MFEDLIVNKYYPQHKQSCLHLPYGTDKHLIELYLVQKEQIWFGNKYGLARRGLTSSQSPFCNPTPNPRCNPNLQVGNPNPNPNPKSPEQIHPKP